jgi:hypothetical protein
MAKSGLLDSAIYPSSAVPLGAVHYAVRMGEADSRQYRQGDHICARADLRRL